MPRRKKPKKDTPEEAEPKLERPPERLSSPFAEALRDLKPEPLAPPAGPVLPRGLAPRKHEEYGYEDRVAMDHAYRGVRPLAKPAGRAGASGPRRIVSASASASAGSDEDALARARLAALVTGGIRFELRRDADGRIAGARAGAAAGPLADLRDGRAAPEATLDLHGLRAAEADAEVVRFVRKQQKRGARVVCIVHGKGLHSEGHAGVLGDRVIDMLTEGGAAPFVLAFVTAAAQQGGTGALLVRLGR